MTLGAMSLSPEAKKSIIQRVAREAIASGMFRRHLEDVQRRSPNAPRYAAAKGNKLPLVRTGAFDAAIDNPNSPMWRFEYSKGKTLSFHLVQNRGGRNVYDMAQQTGENSGRLGRGAPVAGALSSEKRIVVAPRGDDAAFLRALLVAAISDALRGQV